MPVIGIVGHQFLETFIRPIVPRLFHEAEYTILFTRFSCLRGASFRYRYVRDVH